MTRYIDIHIGYDMEVVLDVRCSVRQEWFGQNVIPPSHHARCGVIVVNSYNIVDNGSGSKENCLPRCPECRTQTKCGAPRSIFVSEFASRQGLTICFVEAKRYGYRKAHGTLMPAIYTHDDEQCTHAECLMRSCGAPPVILLNRHKECETLSKYA